MNETPKEDEEGDSPFFALPPGIADFDDSAQSLCAAGTEFADEEEEDEGFLSSGEDTSDFGFIFPPSKKYEALRLNNQAGPSIQSLWSFGASDASYDSDEARYSSAESLFSKDFLPFHLKGKTSASTGDIPHFSETPSSPRIEPSPTQFGSPERHDYFPPGNFPQGGSFMPDSPPYVEERTRTKRDSHPTTLKPFVPSGPERQYGGWKQPHYSPDTNHGYHHQASQPMKIHSTTPGGSVYQKVQSPPRASPPSSSGMPNGYPASTGYYSGRGPTRTRSQSIPNMGSHKNHNGAHFRRTHNSNNNNNSNNSNSHHYPPGPKMPGGSYLTAREERNGMFDHFAQQPQPPQHSSVPVPKGGHPYAFPPFGPQQFSKQSIYWQGYPPPPSQQQLGPIHNPILKGGIPPPGLTAPPTTAVPKPPNQRYPSPRGVPSSNASLSTKALREKLLDNQDATVPPPSQKRKVKGTWKVKAKAVPATEQKESKSEIAQPDQINNDVVVTVLTEAAEGKASENGTNNKLPEPKPAEIPTKETSVTEKVNVEKVESKQVDQPSFLVLESKNNDNTVTAVKLAVEEKPATTNNQQSEEEREGEDEEEKEEALEQSTAVSAEDEQASVTPPEEDEPKAKKAEQKGKKKKAAIVPVKRERRRKSGRKKPQDTPNITTSNSNNNGKLIEVVVVGNGKPEVLAERESEPGVSSLPRIEEILSSSSSLSNVPSSIQRRSKQAVKQTSVAVPENVNDAEKKKMEESKGPLSSILYGVMIVVGIVLAVLESSVCLVGRLHKHALLALLMSYNVLASVLYIYAFPYIAAPFLPVTEWAPAILWYLFLGWFLFAKSSATPYTPTSLGLRVLLPILFLIEGVRNPTFVTYWSGGERLVLAFVLLSLKGEHFFKKRVLISLAVFVVVNSVLVDQSVPSLSSFLAQWMILIVSLSNHYQCCSSLKSPLRLKRKHLCKYIGRSKSFASKIRAAHSRFPNAQPRSAVRS